MFGDPSPWDTAKHPIKPYTSNESGICPKLNKRTASSKHIFSDDRLLVFELKVHRIVRENWIALRIRIKLNLPGSLFIRLSFK